ncbi:MAG: DMT family transporter, partial [Clostridiales bacterium]|nr:DMT family transporter [Clostridiales bacterium]
YTHAPGREVSVYDYSQIIFSAVFGYFLFQDIPDGWSFLGYVLIIGAAVAIFFYNNRDLKGREA